MEKRLKKERKEERDRKLNEKRRETEIKRERVRWKMKGKDELGRINKTEVSEKITKEETKRNSNMKYVRKREKEKKREDKGL